MGVPVLKSEEAFLGLFLSLTYFGPRIIQVGRRRVHGVAFYAHFVRGGKSWLQMCSTWFIVFLFENVDLFSSCRYVSMEHDASGDV